jgi:hypothetical protein
VDRDDVLHVLTHISGLGERRRVRHGEGHVESTRQRLRQQRLARSRRADQEDVRLGEFDVVMFGLVVKALVLIGP